MNRGSVPTGTVIQDSRAGAAHRPGLRPHGRSPHGLRAHYGRYYDALFGGQFEFMDLSQRASEDHSRSGRPKPLHRNRSRESGQQPRDQSEHPSVVHQDTSWRIERELFANFSTTAQYISRKFRDFMGFVDTGSTYASVQRPDPGAGRQTWDG